MSIWGEMPGDPARHPPSLSCFIQLLRGGSKQKMIAFHFRVEAPWFVLKARRRLKDL